MKKSEDSNIEEEHSLRRHLADLMHGSSWEPRVSHSGLPSLPDAPGWHQDLCFFLLRGLENVTREGIHKVVIMVKYHSRVNYPFKLHW